MTQDTFPLVLHFVQWTLDDSSRNGAIISARMYKGTGMRQFLPIVWLAMLGGCQSGSASPPDYGSDIEELKSRVDGLEQFREMQISESRKLVMLKPSEKGFGALATDIGTVAVAIKDVKPYADGTRLILQIGNPTSATITSFSADFEWGSAGDENSGKHADSREFKRPLESGSWNILQLDFAEVPPTKFGFVTIYNFVPRSITLTNR